MFPEHPPTRRPPTARPRPSTHHPAQRSRQAIAIGAAVAGVGLVGVFALTNDVGASTTTHDQPTSLAPSVTAPAVPDDGGFDGPFAPDGNGDDGFSTVTPAIPSFPGRQPSSSSHGS